MTPRPAVRRLLAVTCAAWLASAAHARAQQPAPPAQAPPAPAVPGASLLDQRDSKQLQIEAISDDHIRLTGQVEWSPPGSPNKFFADQIDIYGSTSTIAASGNVVFQTPEGQINAERVEFNVSAGTGTFYNANGFMSMGAAASPTEFGSQTPDFVFDGEKIEKLGSRRYRITSGSITTCVQPTPRWQLVAGSATLNLDEYAIARNTVLRVKGVPLMYLPIIYYPIQADDRATGFLLPTYGQSTLRGQAISNAFFWALGRSHDATFFHDWFTRAGQGAGAEYRYIAGPQSLGNLRFYRFNQREGEYTSDDGTVSVLPKNTSFEVAAVVNHSLSPSVRARARVDYFSDLVSQQLYQQNVYQASRRNRVIEAGMTAGLGAVSSSILYQRNEQLNSTTNTQVYGSTPKVTATVAPRRLFSSPVYGSINADYAYLPYRTINSEILTRDDSLSRFDVTPTIRVPLSRLPFLTVNTSANYRATYYSRQWDDEADRTVDGSYIRDYIALRSDIVGPVLTRIWDLDSDFAERLKHVIEPTFTLDFTSAINDYRRTPVLGDQSDVVVSGASKITYGLTNRLFARSRPVNGSRGQTREFVTLGIQQTYYSNPESSQYDSTYRSSQIDGLADLSPVALNVRVSPSAAIDATGRVEYDVSGRGLQVVTSGGNMTVGLSSVNVNYSHVRRESQSSDNYLSTSSTSRFLQGRATGTYALSWDIARSYVVSQRVIASYMAQCCGLQVEFQSFNYPETPGIPISSDRRFNFGFVLAGLGTFSNFFGAFGGQ